LPRQARPQAHCGARAERSDVSTPKERIQKWRRFDVTANGMRWKTPRLEPRTELSKNTTQNRQRGIAGMSTWKQ
jgi:hypothetical protein